MQSIVFRSRIRAGKQLEELDSVAKGKEARILRIVVPVFNDWESLRTLLQDLDQVASSLPVRISITVVNDGSTIPLEADFQECLHLEHVDGIQIIHLITNLGHQRALAVGLCVAVEDGDCDAILVMDADGEDSPHAISDMLHAAGDSSDFCVVARRGKRSENFTFKLSYLVYKLLFKLLTGRKIAFGNFCLLSRGFARRLVCIPDLWNNLPAAVLRSKLPIREVPIDRARRYAGESKMSFTTLVVHGLSGLSVYAETIFARFLILTLVLFLVSGASISLVLTLRIFFPKYATPGWASTVSFGISIILVQTLSFTLSFILMLLNSRVQRLVIPFAEYKQYVDSRQTLLAPVLDEI